ncbi:TnsD family Tn7-like transposition protein [Castellaniella sp. S9]|uniref:TnsD family Tn7-like transposition protein n=1 Tax=Castellaniella sp. S9 TaxID=2993652 RepID=UPI0022B44A66|nr:TnsD family Tn7-like transposition protein [Castellaniella sp. S9]
MDSFEKLLELNLRLPITCWFEDETLYSLCCRYHYVTGNTLASISNSQLFGHPRHGSQHDFASRINVFVERTQGHFGVTSEEIIYKHTILPFFLRWKSAQEAQDLVHTLSQGHASAIKSRLGLPSSGLRAHHPLKACPSCMSNDQLLFGTSYWHLTHQLPGVWVCPTHGCMLLESTKKSTGIGQFLWYLPHKGSFYETPSNPLAFCAKSLLQRLANIVVGANSLSWDTYIDSIKLCAIYRDALYSHGLLRGNTQIALKEAADSYFRFLLPLQESSLDLPLPLSPDRAKLQLSRLLSHPQRSTHPLRHLLIILWLYGQWDTFWFAYTHPPYKRVNYGLSKAASTIPSSTKSLRVEELLNLVNKMGLTISKAAAQVGVSVSTAQAWASSQGVQVDRRSKLPKPTIQSIVCELRTGADKAILAARHQVSIQTITRLLRTESGLHQDWRDARIEGQRMIAKRTWMETIARHPDAILTELRTLQPAYYSWLYRHDKQWLIQSLTSIPKYLPTSQARVDWGKRDEQLACLIEKIGQEIISQQSPIKPVRLQQLYQVIPKLKPYLGKLDRLPQTRNVIEQIRQNHIMHSNHRYKA